MMLDLLHLALALMAGAVLGVFFFGGLWLTLRQLPKTKQPMLLVFGSLLGRSIITVAGFYWVMGGSWQRLLAAAAGFILMRQLLIRRVQRQTPQPMTTESR